MIRDITLGQFIPGDTVIHRLDPRTKIVLTVAYLVGVFAVTRWVGFVLTAAFVAVCAGLAHISPRYLLKSLRPLVFIIAFTAVLNLFMGTGDEVLVRVWFLRITAQGLSNALYFTFRLVFLVIGTSLMTLTTSPIALTDGLERLFSPLKVIRFPAHEMAMMMSIALRFIPTLLEETDKIMKAQSARGADFETGNLFRRARAMIPLLVPLFVSAFRRAGELAMAMEARCYRGGDGRTRLRVLKFGRIDLIAALVTAAFLAGMFIE